MFAKEQGIALKQYGSVDTHFLDPIIKLKPLCKHILQLTLSKLSGLDQKRATPLNPEPARRAQQASVRVQEGACAYVLSQSDLLGSNRVSFQKGIVSCR